jgi:hypothetical protein
MVVNKQVPDDLIIKKVAPTFTGVVTTMDKYKKDGLGANGLIDPTKTEGSLKEWQYVIAVGSSVRVCKEGDLVKINPSRYAQYQQRQVPNVAQEVEGYKRELVGYKFRTVQLSGEKYLLLQDSDIEYVVEEYEEVKVPVVYTDPKDLSN